MRSYTRCESMVTTFKESQLQKKKVWNSGQNTIYEVQSDQQKIWQIGKHSKLIWSETGKQLQIYLKNSEAALWDIFGHCSLSRRHHYGYSYFLCAHWCHTLISFLSNFCLTATVTFEFLCSSTLSPPT